MEVDCCYLYINKGNKDTIIAIDAEKTFDRTQRSFFKKKI